MPLDRTHYDRSDALNAIAHHLNRMLEDLAHVTEIAQQFNLDLMPPPKKPLLEALSRAAALKHTPKI
jgi:hypothetical protein